MPDLEIPKTIGFTVNLPLDEQSQFCKMMSDLLSEYSKYQTHKIIGEDGKESYIHTIKPKGDQDA